MIPIPPHATRVAEIADIIQAALAPVFLLAGIAGFVNVLTGRLSRIIDRIIWRSSSVVSLKGEGSALSGDDLTSSSWMPSLCMSSLTFGI